MKENRTESVDIQKCSLENISEQFCTINDDISRFIQNTQRAHLLPSPGIVKEIIENLRSILFPGYFHSSESTQEILQHTIKTTMEKTFNLMKDQIERGLCFLCQEHPNADHCHSCEKKALQITTRFFSKLPSIRHMLATDVKAAYEGDPAATSTYETIFSYPGISAITNYRIAHELHLLGVPIIPRIITEQAHSTTGIDIHPGAVIGNFFFIDHGTGVVIGETCIIGKNVRIYQGVTLGAQSFPLDKNKKPIKGIPRHPVVEDDVIIYSGATILGRVVIGKGSIIGGNVWLIHSVPPGSRIVQVEARTEIFQEGAGI